MHKLNKEFQQILSIFSPYFTDVIRLNLYGKLIINDIAYRHLSFFYKYYKSIILHNINISGHKD